MLVTFPFGLFVSATVFDLADVAGGPAFLGEVGYWTAIAALMAAGLAGVAGMIDLWDVRPGRTRRTVITFNLVNAGDGRAVPAGLPGPGGRPTAWRDRRAAGRPSWSR